MGRHSSPERTPFVRSLGAWALPWLLIVAVLVIALVVVFDMVGNDPIRTAADGETQSASTPDPGESDDPEVAAADDSEQEAKPDDQAKEEDKPKKEPADKEAQDAAEPKLITEGIQVQVLNGTADPEADDLMADRLARLGYSVVAVSPSSKGYAQTVVFWTGEAENIAEPLAERFDWGSDPAPSNLSSEVQLHVVVGEDAL